MPASDLFAHLVTAWIAIAVPWRGRRRIQLLRSATPEEVSRARSRMYRRSLIALPILAGAAALAGYAKSASWFDLGIRWPLEAFPVTVCVAFLGIFVASTLARRNRSEAQIHQMVQLAGPLLPQTQRERWMFAGLSVTAGVCEEFLYRGYVFFYLRTYLPGIDPITTLWISSIIFGIAHAYQGPKGMLLTGALGVLFGAMYISTSSLLLPMILHTLLDLRIPFILSSARVRELIAAQPAR
jgi:membrane protease YdiL (CAAX protease family)